MTVCALILGCLFTAPPSVPSPDGDTAEAKIVKKLYLADLQNGDHLTITTTQQSLEVEVVNAKTGEVRITTSTNQTPTRAFINGATAGPQPEIFVMMGVLKTGLRLEVVATESGGADSLTGRSITAPVTKIETRPRKQSA